MLNVDITKLIPAIISLTEGKINYYREDPWCAAMCTLKPCATYFCLFNKFPPASVVVVYSFRVHFVRMLFFLHTMSGIMDPLLSYGQKEFRFIIERLMLERRTRTSFKLLVSV